uniref:Uncharacterized protein LOC102804571 n=1 Tax=Saccoglossus kowalevskii TaxID=10224 RepID=A0ABM0LYH5_SACKO|nr:PREDICTED: uncharacterized protein LOC102804571 [Saccoglossus kowalevskii]
MSSWLSHFVNPDDLDPGDHIYVYRGMLFSTCHGIYIGSHANESAVIHFIPDHSYKEAKGRVYISSLTEFRLGFISNLVTVRKYRYGVPQWELLAKRRGSCSMRKSGSNEKVIQRAWDCYNGRIPTVGFNTSEDFALFCKLGHTYRDSSYQ